MLFFTSIVSGIVSEIEESDVEVSDSEPDTEGGGYVNTHVADDVYSVDKFSDNSAVSLRSQYRIFYTGTHNSFICEVQFGQVCFDEIVVIAGRTFGFNMF